MYIRVSENTLYVDRIAYSGTAEKFGIREYLLDLATQKKMPINRRFREMCRSPENGGWCSSFLNKILQ